MKKPSGRCPYCERKTRATVTDESKYLRDKCKCNFCGSEIQICIAPGCKDFARSDRFVADAFCAPHHEGAVKVARATFLIAVTMYQPKTTFSIAAKKVLQAVI